MSFTYTGCAASDDVNAHTTTTIIPPIVADAADRASPNAHAIVWRQVQLLSGFHRERRVPIVEIAHRIRPILRRSVLIADDEISQQLVAHFRAPRLRKRNEE